MKLPDYNFLNYTETKLSTPSDKDGLKMDLTIFFNVLIGFNSSSTFWSSLAYQYLVLSVPDDGKSRKRVERMKFLRYKKEEVVWLPMRQLSTRDQNDTEINNYKSPYLRCCFSIILLMHKIHNWNEPLKIFDSSS